VSAAAPTTARRTWLSEKERDGEDLRDHRDCDRPGNDEFVQKPHGYALTLETVKTDTTLQSASRCERDTDQ
jgi:hypothetical protein